MALKKNQNGFSAVETILVVVIAILLAVVGYLVWHNHHHQPVLTKSTATTASKATTKPKQTTIPTQKYLTITEWGVKMQENDQSSDAYYVLDPSSDGNIYDIDSHQLDALKANDGTSCTGEYIGIVSRLQKNDPSLQSDPTTALEAQSGITIGDYIYILVTHKEYAAPCLYDSANNYAPIQANLDVYNAKVKAYTDMFSTIQAE